MKMEEIDDFVEYNAKNTFLMYKNELKINDTAAAIMVIGDAIINAIGYPNETGETLGMILWRALRDIGVFDKDGRIEILDKIEKDLDLIAYGTRYLADDGRVCVRMWEDDLRKLTRD